MMAILEEELERILNVGPELGTEEARHGFRITTEDLADWALRKIARLRAEKQAKRELAQREIGRIQDWLDRELARLDRDEQFFVNALTDYHRSVLAVNPRAKTISLPHGTVKARVAGASPALVDEAAALAWAENARPEVVKVKKSLDWAGLKKLLAVDPDEIHCVDPTTGEVVPGVTVKPETITFTVTTDTEVNPDA